MKKVELMAVVLAVFLGSVPFTAHARNCELPHEQIQMKCGGDSANTFDAESASGLETRKKSARDLLKAYREKAQVYGAIVKKANDDYRQYIALKNQNRDEAAGEALASRQSR
ncbi:MAG: hypothetical protein HY074_11205 [Deltaproteobacteria bacterium]|nr:hypothetical protein [Deltaproteobacteria bacterium]